MDTLDLEHEAATSAPAAAPAAPATVRFTSAGVRCSAWFFEATSDALATGAGRPAVVMGHGLAGTKDSGLEPFARAFAAAGLDVLAFDYRGFGESDGTPRQRVRLVDQVADFHAAVDAAARLPGVDRAGSRCGASRWPAVTCCGWPPSARTSPQWWVWYPWWTGSPPPASR